jgi:peptide/nickel transport system permease protein
VRQYFGRKLFTYTITFFIAATIDWLIPRLMPGDPIASLMARMGGGGAVITPAGAKAMQDYYNNLFGLNKSMPEQFINFWISMLHGDLGRSIFLHGTPVTQAIMAAVPYTLALLIPAILLSWIIGNTAGAIAARRRVLDNTVLPLGYVLTATPYMWLGIVLSFLFAYTYRIFPLGGGYGFNLEPTLSIKFAQDLAWHWMLPFLSLFLVSFGGWAIGMRNMIIYELESDYSRYLESLGAPQGLIRKYAFRNAMLPQITGLALQLGVIVAGNLVTEVVFQYPGIGQLAFNAIKSEDYFLLQGIFLFIIIGVLLANFLVDVAYVIVDPRTRVGMRGGTA